MPAERAGGKGSWKASQGPVSQALGVGEKEGEDLEGPGEGGDEDLLAVLGAEVGADLAEADGGVGADALLGLCGALEAGEVLHELHVEVGLAQLGGQVDHGLHRALADGRVRICAPIHQSFTSHHLYDREEKGTHESRKELWEYLLVDDGGREVGDEVADPVQELHPGRPVRAPEELHDAGHDLLLVLLLCTRPSPSPPLPASAAKDWDGPLRSLPSRKSGARTLDPASPYW